ncbi:Inositol 2-dehydrogenase/D-chiro-inositol 3-dehydrogenase [Candidatus Lokiarchaeum ossiferum]|uniref:Inositol 2-dehydrogenase/D-chiro-inositol 3-dehydrogenase n=1 Tax=Candidatus Lokiarchaeum ossiferum TaxID=2951803 RepID=A0ABY6HVP6_9ARCH|nr:Inositol 2-dehydrogenase/D-chiro-inositol 3-dehydrogenase [Candidatus Lokiarchaeum sp. B-35]
MGTRKIKYGLAGFGLNGWGHIMEIKFGPLLRGRAEFIACFDPNPKNQQKLSKHKNVKIAQSFEDLLDTPGMDAIIVSSPPQFHADQVVAGLEAGKHVYSEVPMALNETEIERIIAAEELSRKKYQYGENYTFFSEVLYAGNLISSGKIGPAVYAESEYLHDVTYRWRQGFMGGPETPRIESWYSLIEPMQYAHTIGPAQVALGGIESPAPFIEVKSYINSNGGYQGDPICRPSGSFQVALFRTENNAVAKCANAFVIAREPTRMMIQVIGRTGSYECYQIGKPGRQFIADGHKITRFRHRKGKAKRVGKFQLSRNVPLRLGTYHGAQPRIMDNWFTSIEKDLIPALNAKVAANMCMAGICAAKSAHQNSSESIPVYNSKH